MDKILIDLIDKKINQLEHFNEITSQMLYEDIDGVGELIEQRQKIVTIVDGISLDIKRFINEQSIDKQSQIRDLFKFEEIDSLNNELLELQKKIREHNKINKMVMDNDKLAYNRFKNMQDELLSEMSGMSKPQKVAEYLSHTAIDISKGSKLNVTN